MTIKPEVLAAIESLENNAFSWIELDDECDKAHVDLQLIRAEILAMDADIELLRVGTERNLLHAQMTESRLAAADALLRELGEWDLMNISAATSIQLDRKIETYLQESGG